MYAAGTINGIFLVANKNCHDGEVFALVCIHPVELNTRDYSCIVR